MNERIKELMTQASTVRVSGFGETEILDPEKFAKLIIKECIAQVEKDHFGGRESWDRSIDNSVNNIKTYFGLE